MNRDDSANPEPVERPLPLGFAAKYQKKPLDAVRLTRVHAGSYTFKIRNTTFEIHQNTEQDSSWYLEWIIVGNDNYSDPMPTLKKCREALYHMQQNPDLYLIK